ncbi:MAG TPA: C13 family peptidase [Allosphingosinicella sp.]|nr:C13 family peptidase [Allosphingosinicella sp.]
MLKGLKLIAALALLLPAAASPQAYQPPRHTVRAPMIADGSPYEILARADAGTQIERDRAPDAELDEHRKLDRALRALAPQRAGTVDAYVVVIALDSDPVFGREARIAGQVLQRRYGAAGRTIVLAGSDGNAPSALPRGTPETLAIALARIAELADRNEDAIILYTTSHGAPVGLYYNDGDSGYGLISPNRLAAMLDRLGLANRLLILNACFAGVFVPRLRSDTSAILTAASSDRSSFGCIAENDWTFFGDALINHALRSPQPLVSAFAEASGLITSWEAQYRVMASQPQISVGTGASRWLGALERRIPAAATQPVGRPAVETSRASMTRH